MRTIPIVNPIIEITEIYSSILHFDYSLTFVCFYRNVLCNSPLYNSFHPLLLETRERDIVNFTIPTDSLFVDRKSGNLVTRFSIRSCGFAIPSSAMHSPRTCTPARFIFAHVEEINDANGQPLSFSSPSSPPIGNPPAVSYPIHMRGPYACDRVADSEHGPRVPVPIQVASSASRRTHHSSSRRSLFPPVSSRVNFFSCTLPGIFSQIRSYISHLRNAPERPSSCSRELRIFTGNP